MVLLFNDICKCFVSISVILLLFHRANHLFYKGDFIRGEVIFRIELAVDIRNGLVPINVLICLEILLWYERIYRTRGVLCLFADTYQRTEQFRLHILGTIFHFLLGIKRSYLYKGFRT